MVSALGSGLSTGRGSARHFTFTVHLFTHVHKWVTANLMHGGNPAMDYHPMQGGVGILSVATDNSTGLTSSLTGH